MNNKIILIIGLPASGKTTFSKDLTDYIIFDDFIRSFYNGKVIEEIIKKNKVCLIDPRLCMFNVFTNIINDICKYEKDIGLILFENNLEKSLNNSKKRRLNDLKLSLNNIKDNEAMIICIKKYSKIYSLDNYVGYPQIIIK